MVNSKKSSQHLVYVREAFAVLHQYKMKLNLAKCTFNVDSGKFLDFTVSEKGIEANTKKIKAIMEMKPPQNIGETQRLSDRVAILNRFVSRSIDKCL